MVTTIGSEPPPPPKKKKKKKKKNQTCHIHSEGYNTKHVDSFKYLCHLLPLNGKRIHGVKTKITIVKDTFCEMEEVTKIRTSPPTIKIKLVKVHVWNILLHGYKTWEVVKETEEESML